MSKHALWIIVAAMAAPYSATLAALPDTVKVFDASGVFDDFYGGSNGAILGGTISIDVDTGSVVSESLYAKFHGHTTLFDAPNQIYGAQGPYGAPFGYYVIGHTYDPNNVQIGEPYWNVGLQLNSDPSGTLRGYSGGPLCSHKTPCFGLNLGDYPSITDYGNLDSPTTLLFRGP